MHVVALSLKKMKVCWFFIWQEIERHWQRSLSSTFIQCSLL